MKKYVLRDPRNLDYFQLKEQVKYLKKLLKLVIERGNKAFAKAYSPPLREEGDTWSSLMKDWTNANKDERVLSKVLRHSRYYLGKRKAEQCPAFQHVASWEVRCRLFPKKGAPYDPKVQHQQALFVDWCSNCLLSFREIKKRIQWKVILNVE